jgi:hypothetical protein
MKQVTRLELAEVLLNEPGLCSMGLQSEIITSPEKLLGRYVQKERISFLLE